MRRAILCLVVLLLICISVSAETKDTITVDGVEYVKVTTTATPKPTTVPEDVSLVESILDVVYKPKPTITIIPTVTTEPGTFTLTKEFYKNVYGKPLKTIKDSTPRFTGTSLKFDRVVAATVDSPDNIDVPKKNVVSNVIDLNSSGNGPLSIRIVDGDMVYLIRRN